MKKRIYFFICLTGMVMINMSSITAQDGQQTREYWVKMIDKIAYPVISSLASDELKEKMPVETQIDRAYHVAYLEAFGRTFCGIASWLELGTDSSYEGKLRGEYIRLVMKALDNATNPGAKDYMNFTDYQQPLVDAAFLAHGLIRSKKQIWDKLDERVKRQIVDCLKSTRSIRTPTNNWLLFSGIIEAFLLDNDLGGDLMRIDYAVNKHLERYKGDGVYGDGEEFHWDYYNSFVIQPMLLDIATILKRHGLMKENVHSTIQDRFSRYAAVLELSISPEGTFPPMGRSLCYRTGVFQALAQASLQHILARDLKPAQVRCALTAAYKRLLDAPNTFDDNGWLKIGLVGHQPSMAESYVNTGSLYLCTTGFLPLGLPATDDFWSSEDEEWTSVKIWKGIDKKADHRL